MIKLRYILPKIMAVITRTPRCVDPIEWSDKSWTHNIFRFYELIFGRRYGIKPELTVSSYLDEEGIQHTAKFYHSFESIIGGIEEFIRSFKLVPFKLYVPMMATPEGFMIPSSPYLFAIAFDVEASGSTGSATSVTYSHTVTGSNTIMWGTIAEGFGGFLSSITYNAVGLSSIRSFDYGNASGGSLRLSMLVAPTTGANNVVGSGFRSGTGGGCLTTSYTGAAQSGQPDSSNINHATSGVTSLSVSTTVVAATCWLVQGGTAGGANGGTFSINGSRGVAGSGSFIGIGDSNAVVSTGSNSKSCSWSASSLAIIAIASFSTSAPTLTASVTMMNAASRLATVLAGRVYTYALSVNMMNAVARLARVFAGHNTTVSAPILSIRQNVSPYATLSSATYIKTAPSGNVLPVLNNEESDKVYFRVYNNFAGRAAVAPAINVNVTTYDGAGHTASMDVASKQWLHVLQSGFGSGSSGPAQFTSILGTDTMVGGSANRYTFEYGSDGTIANSEILTGSNFGQCGFLEAKTYIKPTTGSTGKINPFVISVQYEYII